MKFISFVKWMEENTWSYPCNVFVLAILHTAHKQAQKTKALRKWNSLCVYFVIIVDRNDKNNNTNNAIRAGNHLFATFIEKRGICKGIEMCDAMQRDYAMDWHDRGPPENAVCIQSPVTFN